MSDGLDEFVEIAGKVESKQSDAYLGYRDGTIGSLKAGSLACYEASTPAFFPQARTITKLEAGVYSVEQNNNKGIYFQQKDIKLDELMILPDMNCDRVLADIKHFWDCEGKFREHKLLWKRGLLLWGPPGSGKTSLLQLVSREIIARDGLTIFAEDPNMVSKALEMLRMIEPNRPIVVILEDIDTIVKEYGEAQLLALLDGEVQIDNVVYIATTNYPENLDKRLINRPSRFDEVIKIDMPTAEARAMYLTTKAPRLALDERELEHWVSQTKDFSVAHLRELVVACECLGKPFDAVMDRLRKMNKAKASSAQTEKPTLGFTADV